MRITLINQAFYPDVVSSGQHLTDLALTLVASGHEVTVITSQRGYDDPDRKFTARETWKGIRIHRLFSSGFGKHDTWRRMLDFGSFLTACSWRLCSLPRQDAVVAMTSPPLLSVLAATFATIRGSRFIYWVMDLNPDAALAAGWLKPGTIIARCLEGLSRWSLRRATKIVVPDRFMRERIVEKGLAKSRIEIIPPWSHDSEVHFDAKGRLQFRSAHGLEGKFVVMYSGNHSPCHPLDTVLAAAERLSHDEEVVFCFVGGGTEFSRVKMFGRPGRLKNMVCLPYQPLGQLSGSLSAADLQLVVMGDPFVGLVHPCKIYNALRVGAPLLYIGPQPSSVTDSLAQLSGPIPVACARHGDIDGVVGSILDLKQKRAGFCRASPPLLCSSFSQQVLVPRLVELITRPCPEYRFSEPGGSRIHHPTVCPRGS